MDKLAKEVVRRENVEINIKLSKSEGESIVWREITNKQITVATVLGQCNKRKTLI